MRVPFADVGPSLIPEWMDDEDALLSPALGHRLLRRSASWISPKVTW